jgi:hypothetical protein
MGWDWVHLVLRPLFGLLYQPRVIDGDDCGAIGKMRIGRGNWSTRRNPAPVPLCPPQIPHNLTWARTQAAEVGSRRFFAWAMARPLKGSNFRSSQSTQWIICKFAVILGPISISDNILSLKFYFVFSLLSYRPNWLRRVPYIFHIDILITFLFIIFLKSHTALFQNSEM